MFIARREITIGSLTRIKAAQLFKSASPHVLPIIKIAERIIQVIV